MNNRLILSFNIVFTLLGLILLTTSAAQAHASVAVSLQQTAGAEIINDEGGPVTISGITDYKNDEIAITGQEPVVALVDMSAQTQRDYSQFAPITGQILGYLTTPLVPPPVEYTVLLPIAPQATPVDLDNDGEEDTGVQIFRLALVSNINGGSYLEQMDQWGYLNSYLVDNKGEIQEGSFLLYTGDDQQGFPASVGEDGLLFTEDDAIVTLPQGYTVARLNADGEVTFDRAQQGRMDILEPAAVAYPDFTDEGILESYNSLIDVLIDEYAFTELRQLDWEEIRATYLPRVEEADANQDVALYSATLKDLAQSIRDAHVAATGPGVAIHEAPIAANLGANVVELADGRFVVTEIAPGSPLDEAGIVFGTEIISVNGETVEERLPSVLYSDSTGTEEGQRLRQVRNLLRFPQDAEVELVYRLPESDEDLSATLTAGAYPLGDPLRVPIGKEIIRYDVIDFNFGYVTWLNFEDPLPTVVPYADFLKKLKERDPILTRGLPAQGLILDMRSNGGGWDAQYLTMASYLFSEEEPMTYHWVDEVLYDDETGQWIPEFKNNWSLSAPDPEAYFGGEVIILVDPSCASSCEFFTALLQSSGRATVMGYYATNGAGGPIKRAALPGGFLFQYPWQGAVFPGTDTQVLEGIGVEPDIRVPVTLESEQARINGEDPLLQAAVATLGERAGERYAASITLVPVTDPEIGFTAVVPEDWAPIGQGIYVASDGATNIRLSVATPPIEDIAAALRPVGVVDLDSALLEEYTANGRTWSIYGTATSNGGVPFYRQIAIANDEDATYSLILASLPFMADALRDAMIKPIIDTFVLEGVPE